MKPHIQPGLLAHHTHTTYVHEHKYSNVQILHGTHTLAPCLSSGTPILCPVLPTHRREGLWELSRGGRVLEEGEVLPPSPHRYLQRVLSLNGTIGQRAEQHTPALPQLKSQTSPPSLDPCHFLLLFMAHPASPSVSPGHRVLLVPLPSS